MIQDRVMLTLDREEEIIRSIIAAIPQPDDNDAEDLKALFHDQLEWLVYHLSEVCKKQR